MNITLRRAFLLVLVSIMLLSPVNVTFAGDETAPIPAPTPAATNPADLYSPSYPRIGMLHFGSAPDDWYAKYDLIVVSSGFDKGDTVKVINPNTIILPTREWAAYISPTRYPIKAGDFDLNAFLAVDSSGGDVYINCCNRLIEMSSFSLPSTVGQYAGMTIREALPIAAAEESNLTSTDGVATDWLWVKPYGASDIDLDRNGVNDYDEHGKDWVIAKWQEGVVDLLANLRGELDKAGPGNVSFVNYGFQFQQVGNEYLNGMYREWTTGFGNNFKNGYFWNDEYKYFMENAPYPHVAMINGRADSTDPFITGLADVTDSRNHLQSMRYLLGVTLLGDAYFEYMTFEESQSTANHHINAWYDEFDLDLGQPTDFGRAGPLEDAQELKSGIWVRFFDKGVSIVNVTGSPISISDQELKSLPGYAGPYWRFKGGQDLSLNGGSALNNGEPFTTVTLDGYSWQKDSQTKIMGDAIILLRSPQNIVSDIIVDNNDFSTSPGSYQADLTGGFALQMTGGRDHWSMFSHKNGRAYDGVDFWHTHARSDGGGTATFTPTIGVGGTYEVFEWHGSLDDSEASNVSVAIHHADGTTNRTLDQSRNDGSWTSLGSFTFNSGTSGKVVISAQGANGPVIADAIKFVYKDGSPPADPPTFADVPSNHWAHDYVEELYQAGYVSGCSSDPLLYCPDATMTRAESAVFVERGIHGASFTPTDPSALIFEDVPLWEWFAKWSTSLFDDGFTSGCGTDPLIYCPLQGHTRAAGSVFFLRMMHGAGYVPPEPSGLFADVPTDVWYADWVEAAYNAGLVPACETQPELKFCPVGPLDRAMAAYMMVQAKGLPLN